MHMPRLAPAAAFGMAACIVLAACGETKPASGLKKTDLSTVQKSVATKINPATVEIRRINGVWNGKLDATDIQAQFGGDGTLSVQQLRNGSIMDDASGTYEQTADGHLKGTLKGAINGLAPYASWTAGFSNPSMMIMTGKSGAIELNRRRGFVPPSTNQAVK